MFSVKKISVANWAGWYVQFTCQFLKWCFFPYILDNQVLMYVPGQMCTLLMVISSCLNHVKNDIIYVWIFNL
jgi:hypothetical protein